MPAAASAGATSDEVLRKVQGLEIRARVLADELLLGTYRSVFKGSGLEFEEVREYEPGDDVRTIDWNVTARMGSPYIKKFREERSLNVYLALDVSASSFFGTRGQSKRELAADVGALLAVAADQNKDRVSAVLFSDRVEKYLPPRGGRDSVMHVIREMAYVEPRRARTDLNAAATFVSNVAKKRGVVFLISDLLDVAVGPAVRSLAQKHDVIALVPVDPRELDLAPAGVIALEDAETGERVEVDTSDRRVRAAYAEAAAERRMARRSLLARMRIDAVELFTDRPYVATLLALFRARARRS